MGLVFDESVVLIGSQKADFGIFWQFLEARNYLSEKCEETIVMPRNYFASR